MSADEGCRIEDSDTYHGVYTCFFEQYNNGADAEGSAQFVFDEMAHYFADADDRYDANYALAVALWETESLDEELRRKVTRFVDSGDDLDNFRDRGASSQDVDLRANRLADLITKLSSPRSSKKRRRRPTHHIREDLLLELEAPDGQKTFSASEMYVDGVYIDTASMIMWGSSGGGLFSFSEQGTNVSAKWIDAKNLEVSVEGEVEFSQRRELLQNFDDKVTIHYIRENER